MAAVSHNYNLIKGVATYNHTIRCKFNYYYPNYQT